MFEDDTTSSTPDNAPFLGEPPVLEEPPVLDSLPPDIVKGDPDPNWVLPPREPARIPGVINPNLPSDSVPPTDPLLGQPELGKLEPPTQTDPILDGNRPDINGLGTPGSGLLVPNLPSRSEQGQFFVPALDSALGSEVTPVIGVLANPLTDSLIMTTILGAPDSGIS